MKALVLGAGGQLGSELIRRLPTAVGPAHHELSVTDPAGLDRACAEHRPDVVFNCAAYNAVDRAELEPGLARGVNATGAANVAGACRKHGARLIHFSTNFVFDGAMGRPYLEDDRPLPLSVYGKSKLEGERAALDILPASLVVRTAAVFGDRGSAVKGGSFPERIVQRAQRREEIRVVSDQRVNPTYAADLAEAAIVLASSDLRGLVHVVAGGCCAWDEFARAVLAECRIDAEVIGITSAELASPARRPLNGCLGSGLSATLRPWREGLADWAARRPAESQSP